MYLAMKKLTVYLVACFAVCFAGCKNSDNCVIIPNHKFDGDGLLLIESAGGDDGLVYVTFLPVCQIDTNNLVSSLRHAPSGLIFLVDYKAVALALQNYHL